MLQGALRANRGYARNTSGKIEAVLDKHAKMSSSTVDEFKASLLACETVLLQDLELQVEHRARWLFPGASFSQTDLDEALKTGDVDDAVKLLSRNDVGTRRHRG